MRTHFPAGAALGRPVVHAGPRDGIRLLSIDEQPAWVDQALGHFFLQLRQLHGLTLPVLAHQLGTTAAVLHHLESGRIRSLPPWPETERIVLAYGRLVAMDLAPAARRIRQLTIAADPMVEAAGGREVLAAGPTRLRAPPLADPVQLPSAAGAAGAAAERLATHTAPVPGRRAGFGAGAWAAVGAAAAVAVVLGVLVAHPWLPGAAATALAESMPEPMTRHLWIQRAAVTTRRDADGLTWLETVDPTSRKADKLPSAPSR